MSSYVFFPDNTVLINFAHLGRVALLGDLIPERQWCNTVAAECGKSAGYPHLSDLATAPAVFGPPLVPNTAERIDTEILRDEMAKPGDKITAHRGEAETIAIIQRRGIQAIFATDDAGAADYASRRGIQAIDTWTLVRLAYKKGHLTADQACDDACTLRDHKRGWPHGVARTREALTNWLDQ